ncbi:MAG: hypothetical protein MZV70_17340 [Desulfobacterales bacterium]|nr:hypothetical protein [Desulfobacterales bacterium]
MSDSIEQKEATPKAFVGLAGSPACVSGAGDGFVVKTAILGIQVTQHFQDCFGIVAMVFGNSHDSRRYRFYLGF